MSQAVTPKLLSRAVTAVLLCAASHAGAQEHSQEPTGLEEVIVTAQKREQSLQDVPMAVSALTTDKLLAAGVQDMVDISHQTPVLEVQGNVTSANTSFRIRRVGNLGNIPTFEPAVGVFIDGAFRSRAVFGAGELVDLERVEILRGPQSTLYGKNTSAGVLGLYTQAPPDEFLYRTEISAGMYDADHDSGLFRIKGGIGGPLTETVRTSLGVSYTTNEATQTQALASGGEDANDLERLSARAQFVWDASDKLSLRFIAGHASQDDKTSSPEVYYDPAGFMQNVLRAFQAAGVSTPCSDNVPHNRVNCYRFANTTDFQAEDATLIGEYALDNGWNVTSITSWDWFKAEMTQRDVIQVSAPVGIYQDTQESESWQQELRVASAGGETVDWLAGVFWYSNDFDRGDGGHRPMFVADEFSAHPVVAAVNQQLLRTPFPLPIATAGELAYLDGNQETDYLGIFGQATWNISDRFAITAGLRWQEESKDASVRQWTTGTGPSIFKLLLTPAAVSGDMSRDTDEVTWTVTPQWNVNESTMLYATAAHGFKSGGFNTGFGVIPIAGREFQDEDIMHYEAGVKSTVLDGRMMLAASVFATDYDNYQDAAFVGAQFTVGNAEETELHGFELEGQWRVIDNLTADFSLSYADLEYVRNTSGQCYPGRVSDSPTTPRACLLDGEHPVNAPEWKTHLGLQYDRQVSWGDMYARADWSWTDEYNTSFSADPRLVQDAYNWLGFRAGTRWGQSEVTVWMDNALDETVADLDAVLSLYAGDGSYQSFMQASRSFGVTYRYNF